MTFLVNIKIYFLLTFRNIFICISQYIVPLFFYLVFSSVLVSIDPTNKEVLIMSMTTFAFLMSCLIGLPGSAVKYSIGDICRAYIAGGIRLWHVLSCIAVSCILHTFIVSIIILATAPVFFGAVLPSNILLYVLCLFLDIIIATSIGLLIGMASKSESMAMVISQVIFLPSIFLSGIMMSTTLLPEFLQKVSGVLPSTHMFLLLKSNDYSQSLLYLVIFELMLLILISLKYLHIIRAK